MFWFLSFDLSNLHKKPKKNCSAILEAILKKKIFLEHPVSDRTTEIAKQKTCLIILTKDLKCQIEALFIWILQVWYGIAAKVFWVDFFCFFNIFQILRYCCLKKMIHTKTEKKRKGSGVQINLFLALFKNSYIINNNFTTTQYTKPFWR